MMCDTARAMSDFMQISPKDYPTRNTFAANGKMHTIRKSSLTLHKPLTAFLSGRC